MLVRILTFVPDRIHLDVFAECLDLKLARVFSQIAVLEQYLDVLVLAMPVLQAVKVNMNVLDVERCPAIVDTDIFHDKQVVHFLFFLNLLSIFSEPAFQLWNDFLAPLLVVEFQDFVRLFAQ